MVFTRAEVSCLQYFSSPTPKKETANYGMSCVRMPSRSHTACGSCRHVGSEAAVPDTAGRTKKNSGETGKTGKDSVGEAFEIRECDVSHDVLALISLVRPRAIIFRVRYPDTRVP